MLSTAKAVMVRLVGTVENFVRLGKGAVSRQFTVMHFQCRRLGVGVDVVSSDLPLFDTGDADRALGTDHVLYEVGGLTHHRPPAGLVPADRPVGKGHLQVPVVVHARHQLVGQPGPDRRDPHRLGLGHLAHDVDVVHAAVDDRRHRRHQRLMGLPHVARGLLIKVHPHHQRFAERLCDLNEPLPGGVDSQDVSNHQLAVRRFGGLHNSFSISDGDRDRLFQKHMTARLECRDGVFGMGIGIGVDRNRIRLRGLQGLVIVGELRIVGPDRVEQVPP